MSKSESEKSLIPPKLNQIDPNVALDMETARSILVTQDPYYAVLLQSCNFRWDERVKTAGVCVTQKAEVELVVSPTFWKKMHGYWGLGLLKHEMLHLVFEHLSRGKSLTKNVANLSMDIALNQYMPIHWLPEGGYLHTGPHFPKGVDDYLDRSLDPKTTPDKRAQVKAKIEEDIKFFNQLKLKQEQSFEDYFLELIKNKDKVDEMMPMDNHEWQIESGEGGEGEAGDEEGKGKPSDASISDELRRVAIDNLLQKALDETRERFPGSVPMHVETAMAERFKPAKINWRRELRKYVGRYLSSQLEGTRCRLNRRLGLAAPGFRKSFAPKIMIGVDASSSVPDSMYVSFMSEIKALLKDYDDRVELFFFDYEVCKNKLKINTLTKVPKRPAYGGTSFQNAVDYATKEKPDLLIMLTDGGDAAPKKTSFPVLWAIYGGYKNPDLIGKVINVEEIATKK